MEAGWLLEEGQRHKQVYSSTTMSQYTYSGGGPMYGSTNGTANSQSPSHRYYHHANTVASSSAGESLPNAMGQSVWEYIMSVHKHSSVFYNFQYAPPQSEQDAVLRPYSNVSNLKLWDYFLKEDLAHGPPYDLEVIEREEHKEEEDALIDGPISPSLRKVVNGCYDNVDRLLPDACHYLIQVCL